MTAPIQGGFRRVAIAGLGLMGGSLARALKDLPEPPHIRALSENAEDVQAGLEEGAVDEGTQDPESLLRDRDLVVYGTPLRATLDLLGRHRPVLEPEAVVTDLASLKVPILARAEDLGLQDRYVGSHPMVGGTGSGFGASCTDLFRGARVWVVPGSEGDSGITGRLMGFWKSLGARPQVVGAHEHDSSMVWVSHLPQLTGNALAMALEGAGVARSQLGSGGLDMTRLAGSPAEMWMELLQGAPADLSRALEALENAVEELRGMVDREDWEGVGDRMRKTRNWVEEER